MKTKGKWNLKIPVLLIALFLFTGSLALSGCGGGGGGGGGSSSSPSPTSSSLAVNGTVYDQAVNGAAISVFQVTSSGIESASAGTATSHSTGAYSLTISNYQSSSYYIIVAVPPTTDTADPTMESVIPPNSSSPATINITPVTSLVGGAVCGEYSSSSGCPDPNSVNSSNIGTEVTAYLNNLETVIPAFSGYTLSQIVSADPTQSGTSMNDAVGIGANIDANTSADNSTNITDALNTVTMCMVNTTCANGLKTAISGASSSGSFSYPYSSVPNATPPSGTIAGKGLSTSQLGNMSVPAPTNLTATAGNAQVTLNWSAVSGTTGYYVYYGTSSSSLSQYGSETTSTTDTVTNLTNGTTYYFAVTDMQSGTPSAYSNIVSAVPSSSSTPPPAALTLTATPISGGVDLSWNSVNNATAYNIYGGTVNGQNANFGVVDNEGTISTQYNSFVLTNGDTYYFDVTPIYSDGDAGANSNIVNIVPPNTSSPVTAQSGPVLTATEGNGEITLAWTSVSGATGYDIYENTANLSPAGNGVDFNSIYRNSTATSYQVTGLSNGEIYYFYVVAIFGNNNDEPSANSNVVSAVPSSSPSAYTYTVGSDPYGIAIGSSDNVWVANLLGTAVTELSPTGSLIGNYTVGTGPANIAIDSSGNIWVTNFGKVTYSNGGWSVTKGSSTTVTELSPTGSLIKNYTVGNNPSGIAIDSSGDVWVANFYSDSVTELSSTGSVIATYPVGTGPVDIAIDGPGYVWVVNNVSNNVTELSPTTGSVIGTYPVGSAPYGIAIDSSGDVWVANNGNGTVGTASGDSNVTELSSSGGLIGTYTAGSYPEGIAIDSSGNIWVANEGSNNVMELNPKGSVIATYPAGKYPYTVAIDSYGDVWVANEGSNNVTELPAVAKGPQYFPYTGPQWP